MRRSPVAAGDEPIEGTDERIESAGEPAGRTGEPIDDVDGTTPLTPSVPDSIREAGRLAPDHWLGMVDPAWAGDGTPPNWALVGQWRSSPEGEIVEWRDNEEYRPSPSALGWPEPADDVDAAVQLAASGYGPGEAVTDALATLPEAAVFVTPEGELLPATAPDGATRVIPVFTSPGYLYAAGRLAFVLMTVRELAERIPAEHVVYLNPSAPVSMTVDTDMLREALERVPQVVPGDDIAAAPRPATVSGDFAAAPADGVTAEDG
ncbi:type VII secretion system-associated protein [Actinomadura sp. DC4]|uniref:type VII secretion system-associated protein n=1 Tax=Actinomadura sp. DC4 TaxID=3055069 RepID=UPI0025B1BDEF|nr:type VII secretion system-associated protein [Actinomadura sp. DC4]MDN3354818.1 type VII secretion system-associated protein [Actinomadura sp. DC4]